MEHHIQQTVEKYFDSKILSIQEIKWWMHTIYKIHIEWKNYILKIRNATHHSNSKLKSNPNDILYESNNLVLLNDYIKEYVPEHICFLENINWLIMSCFDNNVVNVLEMMKQEKFILTDSVVIWKNIAHIHKQLMKCLQTARVDDIEYSNQYYNHRFDIIKSNTVNELLQYLQNHKYQTILWDLNPANLFIANNKLKICDFECVHLWTPLFDLWYLIAHFILHYIKINVEDYISFISNLISQYASINPILNDENINRLKNITLLMLLNRLTNTFINYEINNLNHIEKERITKLIIKLINNNILSYNEYKNIVLQLHNIVNE
jgi:hypothetical protein